MIEYLIVFNLSYYKTVGNEQDIYGRRMFLTYSIKRGVTILCLLMALGFVSSVMISLTDTDLSVASRFYVACDRSNSWPAGKSHPFGFLYRYGEIPGIAMGILALAGYALIRIGRLDRRYAKPFLVVILSVILGPGLVVNGILKEFWGRPRPADLQRFGSTEQYRHFWDPGGKGTGKSFVCGHCAIAFSTCSVIAFYPIHSVAASVGLGAGLVYGGVVSLTRIVQGGHFTTDVVWSAVITLSIITILYYFIFRIPDQGDHQL